METGKVLTAQEKLINDAVAAAVLIAEKVEPTLSEKEQALFIAGFQECIKWQYSNQPSVPLNWEKGFDEQLKKDFDLHEAKCGSVFRKHECKENSRWDFISGANSAKEWIKTNLLSKVSPNMSQNIKKCDILENDSNVSDVAKPVTETIEVDDLNEKIEELELKLEEKTRHCSEWAKKAVEAGNRASELQRKLSSIKEIEVWKEIEIKEGCEFPPLDDEGVFCLSDSDKYHLRFSDEEERESAIYNWKITKWLKKLSIPVSGGDLKNDYEAEAINTD